MYRSSFVNASAPSHSIYSRPSSARRPRQGTVLLTIRLENCGKKQTTTLGCGKRWLPAIKHAKIVSLFRPILPPSHSALCFLVRCLHFYSIHPPTSTTLLTQFRNSFTRSATSVKHSPKEVQYPISAWASHRSSISTQPCHPYLAFTTQAKRL